MWVLRVLPVLLLTRAYGVIGVWATMTAELVARGLLCFWRLYREVAEHVKNKFLTCSQTRLLCISSRGKISTLCKLE